MLRYHNARDLGDHGKNKEYDAEDICADLADDGERGAAGEERERAADAPREALETAEPEDQHRQDWCRTFEHLYE